MDNISGKINPLFTFYEVGLSNTKCYSHEEGRPSRTDPIMSQNGKKMSSLSCFCATDNVQCQFAVHLKKFKHMFH